MIEEENDNQADVMLHSIILASLLIVLLIIANFVCSKEETYTTITLSNNKWRTDDIVIEMEGYSLNDEVPYTISDNCVIIFLEKEE